MKPPTIIGTTSFSASGGSAITNILEEFSSIKTLKGGAEFECKFFAENIFALEMAIKNNYDIDKTIKLFIQNAKRISFDSFYEQNFSTNFLQHTYEYIDSIAQHYLGGIYRDYEKDFLAPDERKICHKAEKLYYYMYGNRKYEAYEPYMWRPSYIPFGPFYYASFDEAFYKKTQTYIEHVFSPLYQEGKKYILGDALYRTNTVPQELAYFKDSKALIANRDPRDLYVQNKEIYGEWYMPTWDLDTWIAYYKYRRKYIKLQKQNNTENILHLQFEELIYNYEESLTKIKRFLSLGDTEHIKKGEIFIPEKSKTNTQLFRKYPKYAKDIEKIEKELSEFCYPYTDEQTKYPQASEIKNINRQTLEDIRKTVCIFQKTGKLPFSNLKGAYLFTSFYELCKYFKNRKTIFSVLKGIIKIIPFLLFLPFDFYIQLKEIIKYQKKNKNSFVEFK